MENRTKNLVRILIVFSLLACTGVTAFITGFGTSALLVGEDTSLGQVLSPTVEPAGSPSAPSTSTPSDTLPTPANSDQETFQLFWEVWDILQRDYYGDLPDMQSVTYGAIQGMLDTLGDDYTSFVEPRIADIFAEDATGTFEGIGALVEMREDGKLQIVNVFPGQPAEQAGLHSGDRVLKVDGESIVGYGLYEAIALIRGPEGSEVTLEVERPEEGTFTVTLTRAAIEIPLVEAEILEQDGEKVGYIHLLEFSSTATAQMEEELEALLAEEPSGLVFDLRDNPGGWLNQAVSVADLFLSENVVLIERSSDGSEEIFYADNGDLAEEIPLVVLVHEYSASASEIVAGAIQAHDRGVLIGTQTFGKGSVQRPYRLSDGSELRVTTALWFTPDDRAIHGQGLTPDIEVSLPEDAEVGPEAAGDVQLDRAVEYLLSGE